MTQLAITHDGRPVDAGNFRASEWEALKEQSRVGDYLMPCCKAPAVLKTSINGLPFFAHFSDECATAPETVWHRSGKAAVLAGLAVLGIEGNEEMSGTAPDGSKWQADILFTVSGRTIAVELQRSYLNLRDYLRRQEKYKASNVECFWLLPRWRFPALQKATSQLVLKREFGGKFPADGIGTGMLAELPVSMLDIDEEAKVQFGLQKSAKVSEWLQGIVDGTFEYRKGSWNLG